MKPERYLKGDSKMKETKFICRKCNRSEPTVDKDGKSREWQFCCGEAMAMGVVIGQIQFKDDADLCGRLAKGDPDSI